jgi:biopolymer transport protein ExbD
MKKRRLPTHRETASEEGTINLTPLIDVVFVVLIMFIIVAPMLEIDHIQLASKVQGIDKEPSIIENGPAMIHVRADNTIWLNKKRVTERELLIQLKQIRQRYPHHIPQLFHDKQAFFGTYQTVKNSIELAGFEEMDLVLQPQ